MPGSGHAPDGCLSRRRARFAAICMIGETAVGWIDRQDEPTDPLWRRLREWLSWCTANAPTAVARDAAGRRHNNQYRGLENAPVFGRVVATGAMHRRDRDLIERLRTHGLSMVGCSQFRKPASPVTAKKVSALERALGFPLPELLRAVYSEVGDGGFGPACGLVGVSGKSTLGTWYDEMLELERTNAIWRWPRRLLPLADYGCGMWSCADCEYSTVPMILWDPNNLDDELGGVDGRLNWGNAFWNQGLSLRRWLEGWLEGRPEPEPRWPSDSWIRRRLGFALPK